MKISFMRTIGTQEPERLVSMDVQLHLTICENTRKFMIQWFECKDSRYILDHSRTHYADTYDEALSIMLQTMRKNKINAHKMEQYISTSLNLDHDMLERVLNELMMDKELEYLFKKFIGRFLESKINSLKARVREYEWADGELFIQLIDELF